MKCILQIGYRHFLLSNSKNVEKIIETLSKSIEVNEDIRNDIWEIRDENLTKVSIQYVADDKIVKANRTPKNRQLEG